MIDLPQIRKKLHAQPEISGEEERTSLFVSEHLKKISGIKTWQDLPHHSLLAEIEGKNPGMTVLFRCELDALPIEETNEISYRSGRKGVSHTCGHDGHMAIMLGVAEAIHTYPPEKGKILLLFQSAEETGKGAHAILDSGYLNKYKIDFVFALHNMPGFEKTDVICRIGNFTPVVESLSIYMKGKTSHAGEPEEGINPARAVAEIINFLESLHEPDRMNPSYFLVTPIQIQMGQEAFGTSAGEAVVKYTFRAWNNSFFEVKKREIEEGVREICKKTNNLQVQLSWLESFKANTNHPTACKIIEKAAILNNYSYVELKKPLTWGEDFGLFTEVYKGAMFGIGAGTKHPALHNPDYDFPDDLIRPGINMYLSIVNEILNK